jgi:hypothetical protein
VIVPAIKRGARNAQLIQRLFEFSVIGHGDLFLRNAILSAQLLRKLSYQILIWRP